MLKPCVVVVVEDSQVNSIINQHTEVDVCVVDFDDLEISDSSEISEKIDELTAAAGTSAVKAEIRDILDRLREILSDAQANESDIFNDDDEGDDEEDEDDDLVYHQDFDADDEDF